MKVNKNNLKDGKKCYLSLTNFVLDRSGNCDLIISEDINNAINISSLDYIFEITLKQIDLETIEEPITKMVKTKRIKNGNE